MTSSRHLVAWTSLIYALYAQAGNSPVTSSRSLAFRGGATPCTITLTKAAQGVTITFANSKGPKPLATLTKAGDAYTYTPDPKLNNSLMITFQFTPTGAFSSDPAINLKLSGGLIKKPSEFTLTLDTKIKAKPVTDAKLTTDDRGYYNTDGFQVHQTSVDGDPLIVFK